MSLIASMLPSKGFDSAAASRPVSYRLSITSIVYVGQNEVAHRRMFIVAFHLIHASDHPQAPVLMTRAYRKVCGEIANSPADNQMDLLTWKSS